MKAKRGLLSAKIKYLQGFFLNSLGGAGVTDSHA
jgi:hypothetical protein